MHASCCNSRFLSPLYLSAAVCEVPTKPTHSTQQQQSRVSRYLLTFFGKSIQYHSFSSTTAEEKAQAQVHVFLVSLVGFGVALVSLELFVSFLHISDHAEDRCGDRK